MSDTDAADTISEDTLFGGRLLLNQFRRGHRVGTDAVLLSAVANVEPGDRFIDVGTGAGAIGIALGLRQAGTDGVLVEIDPQMADLARENVALNGLGERISVRCVDLFDMAGMRGEGLAGSASLVVSNPPFFRSGSVHASPYHRRAAAHVLPDMGDNDATAAWTRQSARLLKPRGRLFMIVRPEVVGELIHALRALVGGLVLMPVHAKAGEPAIRVLVGGAKGSRAPLTIRPGFILHEADGAFTQASGTLHDGGTLQLLATKNRPLKGRFSVIG